MFAAAATCGDVLVKNIIPKHMEGASAKLMEMGCIVEEYDDAIRVIGRKPLKPTRVKTAPYPGFPTDMQPQIAVTLALADGTSMVTESIFENRFKYLDELARMGAGVTESQLHAERIDGYNPLAVIDAYRRKLPLAKSGEGPIFLDVVTYRLLGHSTSDQNAYRTKEEIDMWFEGNAVNEFKNKLIKAKDLAIVLRRPAKQSYVIHNRLGKISLLDKTLKTHRAMAL